MNKKFTPVLLALFFVLLMGGIFFSLANKTKSSSVPSSTDRGSVSPSVTVKQFSLTEISTHKDASSCWSSINGKVYDLTSWINQHPGGPERILSICGIDGSSAFNAQHGGQARPADELSTFYIGELSSK